MAACITTNKNGRQLANMFTDITLSFTDNFEHLAVPGFFCPPMLHNIDEN